MSERHYDILSAYEWVPTAADRDRYFEGRDTADVVNKRLDEYSVAGCEKLLGGPEALAAHMLVRYGPKAKPGPADTAFFVLRLFLRRHDPDKNDTDVPTSNL